MTSTRTVKKLADYQPSAYQVEQFTLTFELHPTATTVTAVSQLVQLHAADLWLDGQALELISVRVGGHEWSEFEVTAEGMLLRQLPTRCELEIVTRIDPSDNTALEGLYVSDGAYCTQCEAEGFRRITYFLDRPDVMTTYTTHVIAPATLKHVLANGNKTAEEQLSDGRRKITWVDPFPKPSYLFALVAGNFDEVLGSYTTQTGREVTLAFYVDEGKAPQAAFALEALKRAMRFDEEVYGLEYDLDIYMVVAVDFFNMGAMENKGLNIFNSKFVLAEPTSATDTDYFNIESIIAHEYFHNWTGNRVTCRDWFQLSLKEGLTVFRDQQFSAAMGSPTLCRIDAIKTIRTAQFAEDAGPMAHAIRPEQVLEMNNFYTVTVYDKGAEVIRMQHTLLGDAGFRRGMDLYFARHDGQAVTCDDFVNAMEDANQIDLAQFRRWYSQAGTPMITPLLAFNSQGLNLTLMQSTPLTADGSAKLPLHIPIAVELIDPNSQRHECFLLELRDAEQRFEFQGWSEATVPVLLTNFSAPVKVHSNHSLSDLVFIAKYAKDGVARWDAMQQLWAMLISDSITNKAVTALQVPTEVVALMKEWLSSPSGDLAFIAELITLPSFDTLAEQYQEIPVDELLTALARLQAELAIALAPELAGCYHGYVKQPYQYEQTQIGARALKNICLAYLCHLPQSTILTPEQCLDHDNMTDVMASLKAVVQSDQAQAKACLGLFLEKFGDNVQLFDKHSNLTASLQGDQVFSAIAQVSEARQFSWQNPNRVRALYSAFAQLNPRMFHANDGRGYQLLASAVMKADQINPQLAARMVTPLLSWKRFDSQRGALMRHQLTLINEMQGLSNDLYEKVQRGLA